ncbi:hypothetical protein TB1_042341 [Malus domestica]
MIANAFSSKYFMLKKYPDSCSSLCTDSLNFSSSRNCRIRNISSLLKDDIFISSAVDFKSQAPNFRFAVEEADEEKWVETAAPWVEAGGFSIGF